MTRKKRHNSHYEFTYFDPAKPEQDKTWSSTNLNRLKKTREDVVKDCWGDNPLSVDIERRRGKKKGGTLLEIL